jgi:hypothetical protein
MGFSLSKWYMDCVTDDGDALIVYRAVLSWRRLRFHYSSTLWFPAAGAPETRTSIRPSPDPVLSPESLAWQSESLGFSAKWTGGTGAVSQTLFENDRGAVRWSCLLAQSDVCARLGDRSLRGRGYVERLDMTLPPWRLPIRELRWGRFIDPHNAVVWIDWAGPYPLRRVFYNGRLLEQADVTDHAVSAANLALQLREPRVLRSGRIAGILNDVPGLSRLLPRQVRTMHEVKWLSRGTLTSAAGAEGWAIHERVTWGQDK